MNIKNVPSQIEVFRDLGKAESLLYFIKIVITQEWLKECFAVLDLMKDEIILSQEQYL